MQEKHFVVKNYVGIAISVEAPRKRPLVKKYSAMERLCM